MSRVTASFSATVSSLASLLWPLIVLAVVVFLLPELAAWWPRDRSRSTDVGRREGLRFRRDAGLELLEHHRIVRAAAPAPYAGTSARKLTDDGLPVAVASFADLPALLASWRDEDRAPSDRVGSG